MNAGKNILRSFGASAAPAVSDAEQRLKGQIAEVKKPGLFSRLFRRRSVSGLMRSRSRCCVVGVMVLVDKAVPIDGLVMEIDTTGALLRPASTYILDRGRAEVLLRFADREHRGQIAGVSPLGYDIVFQTPLSQQVVDLLVRDFGTSLASGRSVQ